jgi:hypothetical protein
MKPKDMLTELEAVAQFIIDKRLTPEERVNTLAESLARFDWNKVDTMPKPVHSLLHYYAVRQGRIVSNEVTQAAAAS